MKMTRRQASLSALGLLSCPGALSGCGRSSIGDGETQIAADKISTGAATHSAESPRNFLFMIIDDLNDWITAPGDHPRPPTPNIDALAASGTVFTNAHAQAPICGPSRASLFSGLYPAQTGIYGQIPDRLLGPAVSAVSPTLLLPQYLRSHGYKTAGRGKVSHEGGQEGMFDEYIPRTSDYGPKPEKPFKWKSDKTHTDWGAYPETDDDMQDFITSRWGADFLNRSHEKPFMLALGFIRPHVPWYVPQHWLDRLPIDEIRLPTVLDDDMNDVPQAGRNLTSVPQMPTLEWAREQDEWPKILQAYLASVAFVDHCVGIVMEGLARSGLAGTTIVCLVSDNGYHLGEKSRFAKMSLWGRSTRVPLIFSGPDIKRHMISDPVGLIDIYPTAIDMLGLEKNSENAGRSLRPYLTGQRALPVRPQISVYGRGNFAVIDDRYRYIRYSDGSEELYDLENDPMEWQNIANKPDLQTVKQRLAQLIPQTTQPDIFEKFPDR